MLIRWLINHFLFAGTSFFAAGAVATGGSTGASAGGATGSDSGAAGGGKSIPTGSESSSGAGASESGAIAESGAVSDGGEEFGDFGDFSADDSESGDIQAGGEEFGPDVYKTVKEALKGKPEVFKQVKKAVSMVKRFTEHFETPEAAGELLTDLQTFGGWDSVKQEIGETATFLMGWNAGDGEVVNKWLDENGEGLTKNMPTILDRWRKVDEAGWASDAAGTFMATMLNPDSQTGLSPIAALNQLAQMEGVKDSDAFKTLVRRIEGIKKTSEMAPQKVQPKADDSKITAREQRVRQQEQEMQRNALGGKAAPVLNKEAMNALQIVVGGRKLTDAQKASLIGDIHQEFARIMAKDADGKAKRQKLLAAGQSEQWLKLVKSAAARTMPAAARNVWRKYAGIGGLSQQQRTERKQEGQQRREAGAATASAGAPETKHPGDGRQVDRAAMVAKFGSRDKADDAFLFGSKDTGGKRVWIEKGTGKLYSY